VWATGLVWTVVGNLVPLCGIRYPDRLTCSEPPYRLRYGGPLKTNRIGNKQKVYNFDLLHPSVFDAVQVIFLTANFTTRFTELKLQM